MTRSGPTPPAMVWPEAAYVVVRDYPEVLRALVAKARGVPDAEARRRFGESAFFLQQAAREWAARAGLSGSPVQAGYGTTEVPESVGGSESGRPPTTGLLVSQVATRLRVSERQVLNLIDTQRLVATRGAGRGRPYLVDEVSVAIEERRRRGGER